MGWIMIKKRIIVLTYFLLFIFLLIGCEKEKNTGEINKRIVEDGYEAVEASSGEVIVVGKESKGNKDNKELSVTVINSTGSDFGLFSIIDPVSKEQINIDSLMKDEEISMNIIWPRNVYELKWAVYDTDGELVGECETDISKADKLVKITILGNGKLENVDVSFE